VETVGGKKKEFLEKLPQSGFTGSSTLTIWIEIVVGFRWRRRRTIAFRCAGEIRWAGPGPLGDLAVPQLTSAHRRS